jgi:hypothetical protein
LRLHAKDLLSAAKTLDRGIKTPRGRDTWNQVTVMRSMRRLGIK